MRLQTTRALTAIENKNQYNPYFELQRGHMSIQNSLELRLSFDESGYAILRDVFSEQETNDIRQATLQSLARRRALATGFSKAKNAAGMDYFGLPELLSLEELAEFDYVVLHPKITHLVQQLVVGSVCYFGDSTAQIGTGDRGFHKDNVNRDDPKGADWQSNYDVFRLAVYTQDTHSFSGGMQLRTHSHRSTDRFYGQPKNIRLNKGDVLVWKLTMTHSGNTLLPRFFPNFSYILPRVTTHLPKWLFLPYEKERVALFMSFGSAESEHTKNYIQYLKNRRDTNKFIPTALQLSLSKQRNIKLHSLIK